jgi:hypothetical protein
MNKLAENEEECHDDIFLEIHFKDYAPLQKDLSRWVPSDYMLGPIISISDTQRFRQCILALAQCIENHKLEKEKGKFSIASQVKSGSLKTFLKSVKSNQYSWKFLTN